MEFKEDLARRVSTEIAQYLYDTVDNRPPGMTEEDFIPYLMGALVLNVATVQKLNDIPTDIVLSMMLAAKETIDRAAERGEGESARKPHH